MTEVTEEARSMDDIAKIAAGDGPGSWVPADQLIEALHRIAEAMKERAAKVAYKRFAYAVLDEIRAIDTAALVKEVCDAD